jgi:RNA ligase
MTFPIINHIEDVLPSIAGRSEFVVAFREDYRVIDYNYALADSFDDPICLECRGLKFSLDGRLLARPLHKFHNVGEKPHTQAHLLDFSRPHQVTEKLDGSMIHACLIKGEVVFMTRMGRTDVAMKAERHLTPALRGMCLEAIENSVTPIFEFTAPDNRIVISYSDSRLSLLALRRMHSGEYLSRTRCIGWAREAGVPLVRMHVSNWASGEAFLDYARLVVGVEGFVVRFDDGLWVKAKGSDYVLKHKAKDSVLQEKNVLALILSGGIDDVLPLLEGDDRTLIESYRDSVEAGIRHQAEFVAGHVREGAGLDQKTFAVEHLESISRTLRPIAFTIRAGKDPVEAVKMALGKQIGSQTEVDSSRHFHGTQWPLGGVNDNNSVAIAA